MKKILFFNLLFVPLLVIAQVRTVVYQNENDAFRSRPEFKMDSKVSSKTMPLVNIEKLLEEDEDTEGIIAKPLRFGYGFDVNYTLQDGSWEEKETTREWNMKIISKGAYSLNFIFDRLQLIKGAELYIYNTVGSMIYGPVTSKQNITEGIFLSEIIAGDEAIIKLIEPNHHTDKSVVSISKVVHAYKDVTPSRTNGFGSASDPCYLDINCYWYTSQWEGGGVALVLLANGTEIASGALLNNTGRNLRPFFLTVFHAVDADQNGILTEKEINNAKNWSFRFRYKRVCNQLYLEDDYIQFNGAEYRAGWDDTDFALMEIKNFEVDIDLTFLGWDRSDNNTTSSTIVHHPLGDVMKISFGSGLSAITADVAFSNGYVAKKGNFFEGTITSGAINDGSSGGPVFNQNCRVVGQEVATNKKGCNFAQGKVYYGRFYRSWLGGGTPDTQLKFWLDPMNDESMSVGPIKTYVIETPAIIGSSDICPSSTLEISTGQYAAWSVTPSTFTITPSLDGTSATVNATTNGQTGTVTAVVNGNIYTKNIQACGISGPPSVCSCNGIFIAENFPGAITWTCSPNLTIKAVNGDTVTVNNKSALCIDPTLMPQIPPDDQNEFSQEITENNTRAFKPICPEQFGWVQASSAGQIVKKDIVANVVCLSDMATIIDYTGSGNMLFIVYLPTPPPSISNWTASHYNIWFQGCSSQTCTFEIDKNLVGTSQYITITSTNACGSHTSTFNFVVSTNLYPAPILPFASVYPNPATDILTIEINEAAAQDQSMQSSKYHPNPAFDIRLYDVQGNLLRQTSTKGGTVQFNVSNLPDGIYSLHIYDGVNETPEIHQIVVEH